MTQAILVKTSNKTGREHLVMNGEVEKLKNEAKKQNDLNEWMGNNERYRVITDLNDIFLTGAK